ncbi:MAG TPA: c-type cytochrome [Acidobacteriaceae bacterium]|nr:c-type cytochrome [Acidobacteriaceae bacterium]
MSRTLRAASSAALLFALTACDPPGKPKPVPPSSQDITDFTTLYGENCAGCHGVNGHNGPGRILNDPLYLALIPRDELQNVIANGRPGTAMPAWSRDRGGPLTPKQVAALVDGIESNWAKPQQFQNAALPPYAAQGEQGDPARGKKLFLRACFMCHGPGARVGPVTDRSYLTLSSDQLLRTSIIVGRPDLGMPDYRFLNLGHALANQDIADLVAYMGSLRPTPPNEQQHVNENGSGESGTTTKGNEGSGHGPGSPRPEQRNEGNKSTGGSSQQGVK